jgi:hypothetical protein
MLEGMGGFAAHVRVGGCALSEFGTRGGLWVRLAQSAGVRNISATRTRSWIKSQIASATEPYSANLRSMDAPNEQTNM